MKDLTFEKLPQAIKEILVKLSNIEKIVLSNNGLQNQDQLLNISEAAKFLNLSKPTIYTLVSQSKIPVNKKGKRLYFSKDELTKWIKSGRKKTIDEIIKEAEL